MIVSEEADLLGEAVLLFLPSLLPLWLRQPPNHVMSLGALSFLF
jgi:hypothetical protein